MQRIKNLVQAKALDHVISIITSYLSSFDIANWILGIISVISMIYVAKAYAELISGCFKAVCLIVTDVKATMSLSIRKFASILCHRLYGTLISISEEYM